MTDERALTVNEASERLKITPKTLRQYLKRGALPAIKIGRVWRISERTIGEVLSGKWNLNGEGKTEVRDGKRDSAGDPDGTVLSARDVPSA